MFPRLSRRLAAAKPSEGGSPGSTPDSGADGARVETPSRRTLPRLPVLPISPLPLPLRARAEAPRFHVFPFSLLPLNSPPAWPQYNGSMERGMRDLKGALDARRLQSLTLETPRLLQP
jgi:hypothetical protein